ncbi:MAG: hypothetical protein Ct9H300mP14_14270 [Gammaproteobacteria bacterium]|nr:MAG: hypothetical protein Ct9H300mP14_14270 [Gammaproteobacteria bacterium]
MYFFSGGGYGGWADGDGLTNGCSTVGISKTQPIEILEQHYPLLFEQYASVRSRVGWEEGVVDSASAIVSKCSGVGAKHHSSWITVVPGPPGIMGGTEGAPNRIKSAGRQDHYTGTPIERRGVCAVRRGLDRGSYPGGRWLWPGC